MTPVTKGKAQAKRKETSRKAEWDKALMTVRKFKKFAEQGKDGATVIIGKNMLVIRTNQVAKSTAQVHQYLEHFGTVQERTVRALVNPNSRGEQTNYRDLVEASHVHAKQMKASDVVATYNAHRKQEQVRDLVATYNVNKGFEHPSDLASTYNLHIEREQAKNLVDAYHSHMEQAKYKDLIEAYNRQVQQHVENYQADRERFVKTLRESPSDEAMDFYRSIGVHGA